MRCGDNNSEMEGVEGGKEIVTNGHKGGVGGQKPCFFVDVDQRYKWYRR